MLVDFIAGIVVAVLGILTLASPVGPHVSASESYASGAIFVILGFLLVLVGYGLWKSRPWAWILGLWAGVVYVVLGILAVSPLFLPVGVVNLLFFYFARAGLKRYLGKVRP